MARRSDIMSPGYVAVGGRERLVYGTGKNPEEARKVALRRACGAGEWVLAAEDGFSVYWVDGDQMAQHADLDGNLREPLRPFSPTGVRRIP